MGFQPDADFLGGGDVRRYPRRVRQPRGLRQIVVRQLDRIRHRLGIDCHGVGVPVNCQHARDPRRLFRRLGREGSHLRQRLARRLPGFDSEREILEKIARTLLQIKRL